MSSSPQPYPLQSALRWSLGMCAPEVRRDLCGHVLLTGGGSCMPGLAQRLKWETLAAVPAAFKPRLLVPAPLERQFGSWIGGSIMSSVSASASARARGRERARARTHTLLLAPRAHLTPHPLITRLTTLRPQLGTFVPMWMTKAEFEEHGAHYIDSKCH